MDIWTLFRSRVRPRTLARWVLAVVALTWLGCSDSGTDTCRTDDDCPAGRTCLDERCVAYGDGGRFDGSSSDGGGSDADGPVDGAAPDGGDGGCVCAGECCEEEEVCLEGTRCVTDHGPCESHDDCIDDSYCHAGRGRCVPYGEGKDTADECSLTVQPGLFRTDVQCEWTGPPEGDPYPGYVHVESTPLVADFGIGHDPASDPQPSIVFVATDRFTGSGPGVIRVIDGRTCEQQATLAEPFASAADTPAIGDLDADGRPEIVTTVPDGTVAAWSWNEASGAWELQWQSTDASASGRHSLSIADLDDTEEPEVLAGGLVYGADGTLRSDSAGTAHIDGTCDVYSAPAIVADVDLDDRAEAVFGDGVYGWDAGMSELVLQDEWSGPAAAGFAAVADFGDFPEAAGDAPGRPEIVVVSLGEVRIQTIAGETVFGPVTLPGGSHGGNPTVADFDGDEVREIGVGGPGRYAVFDMACTSGGGPGECSTGTTDGVLWERPVQDGSCGINGSTVFDFEGDDRAEVVYSDECYVRVFDGRDGTVVWSAPRSSGTWIEAPVVADADGDFRAEIVSGSNSASPPSCPSVDPIFPGLRCEEDGDCPTAASTCDGGLCRCEDVADCGGDDQGCVEPLAGTPGDGRVCRATRSELQGVRVYSDVRDRWAGSRPIWNQHAYAVTNVADDGSIPRASEMRRNWDREALNNFRQNVQGELAMDAAPDVTVRGVSFGRDCSEEEPELELTARVCNRGRLAVGAGIRVRFFSGDPAGGDPVCETSTTVPLAPGDCEEVSCTWSGPPLGEPLDIRVRADGDEAFAECYEGNNDGTIDDAQCPPPVE